MAFSNLSLEHSSTVDRVADELRRALFDGEVGPGTPLREVALAEAMGVARSTIREALAVLVAEGLAVREPNRGVHVSQPDPEAVEDVCRARIVLETAGVRRWAEASEEARDVVRRALEQLATSAITASAAEFTAQHLAFHQSLVGLTESPRLLAQAESLYAEIRLALAHVDRLRRNQTEQVESHRLIVRLLEQGRIDETVAELERHITDGAASMLGRLTT
ncbi:MAG TPA: GntR family transcriptional regulator [Nocardioidaceae bacterium]|nr:GntR family transcriptional regulator [Nocardioidaceae bacterium]